MNANTTRISPLSPMHLCVVDANVILRYLIGDGGDQAQHARNIIESGEAYTYPEVIAEVVYVLSGVYGVTRTEICDAFRILVQHMSFYDLDMLLGAFNQYELTNMDFVDCLLVSRNLILGERVVSFDKQVQRYAVR